MATHRHAVGYLTVYAPAPAASPSKRGQSSSRGSTAAEQRTAAVCVPWHPDVLTSWTAGVGPDGERGGFGLVENAWGCPGRMADGSRRRSRQSDKVKPLPCTLTEVFHATAAWRQNPTKTAGIAFQTGMPVDNMRPPVISITIIPSGLGPVRHVPAYRQASFPPNPSSPFPASSSYRLSEPMHFAITSISFRSRRSSLCCPAQCGPDPDQVQDQSPTGNAHGHMDTTCVESVGVRNAIRNHETTTETISSLPARSHCCDVR